jgi:CheY-like chemotaxis protein
VESNEQPILVVDDDDACRALVTHALERVGFATREAATGTAALAAAAPVRITVW